MVDMMGQKHYVTLKMHRQLYKEHLSLQKSFCALYRHMAVNNNTKDPLNWIQEKNRLEATIKSYKTKNQQLCRKLDDANERCELLEFCLLELENQAKVCSYEDFADKSVSTEDTDWKEWERNILNNCHDCSHTFQKIMNSELLETEAKVSGSNTEMEKEDYRLQLEETQKKLSDLTAQMDDVLQCNCKLGVGMDYVISTVHELQSLMEWTAEKKEAKADSTVIFQKLQQLERIQKDLEKTATESEIIRTRAEQERSESLSFSTTEANTDSCHSPDMEDISIAQDDPLALLDNCVKKIELLSSSKPSQTFDASRDEQGSPLLIDLNTPESEDLKIVDAQDQSESKNDSHDSLGPNISEDEGLGEESRRGDSTGPSSFIELQDSSSDTARLSGEIQCPVGSQITVIDPEGHQKDPEWTEGGKDEANTLDLCLCAIGNLRESLRAKENELLKLSAIQSDQKEIAALQEVVVSFHKDTAVLKSELEKAKKENVSLKEQVLELEEAENDSRLQAQKLGEKLLFLQEKDNHFQAKLYDTKQALEKSHEEIAVKEKEEQELRSQLKYMEALVQKYEDQIRTLEIVEIALRKKLIEEDEAIQKAKVEAKSQTVNRGTQIYEPPSRSPFREVVSLRTDDPSIQANSSLSERSPHCSVKSVDVCVQAPEEIICHSDCSIQTETVPLDQFVNPKIVNQDVEILENTPIITVPDSFKDTSQSSVSSIECPIQKELLKRLHQLVEEDAHLQQQLHYVDQINLTLWKKLHNLEFHIGECRKKNIGSEDGASDSCLDSECDFLSSRPVSREQIREDSNATSKCPSPITNRGIIACLDQSEHEIKERLSTLEQINSSFEKELELREKLYIEKERKYGEWVQTEQRFIGDLKRLSDERDSLMSQVEQLQKEKLALSARVLQLQTEMEQAAQTHKSETDEIKAEQAAITSELQQKVDTLLFKEKEHLKQITNLKLERSKSGDKLESDKLKSSYVELQLELSRTRDDMRKKEEGFRIRLDEARGRHVLEEARLVSELELLRHQNSSCDEMICSFQARQSELVSVCRQKEQELAVAREEHKRGMEAAEEEHRAVEAELKLQLRRMEEGTSVATRALAQERLRLERELQENIDDLRSKEEVYKARISELESNVSQLHEELHRLTGALGGEPSSFRREKLLGQLRELRDRETELREKLDEMEAKEAAYRETLEHADRIVAQVEQGYRRKIDELEISERALRLRVLHLEQEESRLRGALSRERRGPSPGQLIEELREAEAREAQLKEQLREAELAQRGLSAKLKDMEKVREQQETELSDKEELVSNLQRTQLELENARKSLSKLKKSESDLNSSLQQTEHILSSTESQMKNRMRVIEEEKKGLEETIGELRAQVRDLKRKLENISYEHEQKRVSASIPKKPISHVSIPPSSADMDEPDYVDVDECIPEPSKLKSSQQYQKGIGNNVDHRSNTLPAKLSSQINKKSYTSLNDPNTEQTSIPQNLDSYDCARQNLEDCMLRAMAAMKSDMQKKKLEREERDYRMKMLLSDTSNNSSEPQVTDEQNDEEENDYDEVLPRPTNFRVVQQVGSDTLLVGWNYINASILEGYEVYLDGQLHETVYTPDRTKALISGLNLKRPLRLSICALSRHGQMSEPTELDVAIADGNSLHDEDNDDDSIYEDSLYEKKRPYSMEW